MEKGMPRNLASEGQTPSVKESPKRPGGALEGKPIQGKDGQWYNQFGEKVPAPESKKGKNETVVVVPPPLKGKKRPGGPLQERPFRGKDGKLYGYE